jgi:spermidine synthase
LKARLSNHQRDVAVASACFVLSGAAALVYQVAWQRLLALTTGVSIPSVAAITAAFMAGLGIGSHLGGIWSERLSARSAIRAFALVEFGVAAFASASVWIYYDGLYRGAPGLYDHGPVLTFLVHVLSLIVPTTLMGMSLPLLVKGLVLSSAQAPRTIGFLYAANALGASAGAFATPWLLLRFLGVDGAVLCGAALSGVAALGALLLSRWAVESGAEAVPTPGSRPRPILEGKQPLSLWIALYALSGFISLTLEVVWFRVLDVMAKGGAFTFGTLLGMYLVGLAAGTLAATMSVARIQRPLRAFMVCQGIMLVATLFAHTLIVRLPFSGNVLDFMVHYGAGSGGSSFITMERFTPGALAYLYVGMPLALFGPATFCMGFGFPILQRAIQEDPESAGRRVGLLQAANIAGCTLGSLVTGLFLLDVLGSAGVFKVLGALGLAIAAIGAYRLRSRSLWAVASALAVLCVVFPDNKTLWLRLHGDPLPEDSFFEEDAASVTGFTPREPGGGYNLWVNGRSISYIPFGSIHTVLGAVPALVHPNPRDVAIIGLGSGDTAWAAGLRSETQKITVFEIATSQPRLLERMRQARDMGRLDEFLGDPRVHLVKDDGRRRLGRDGLKYDIIEADALHSDSSLAGNLYSVEFYQLVSKALKPGGIMCAWVPTRRSEASALRAFPYAIKLPSLLVLSNQPLALEREAWIARLESETTRRYLGRPRLDRIREALVAAREIEPGDMSGEFNTDLQPKDEYARPRKRPDPARQ